MSKKKHAKMKASDAVESLLRKGWTTTGIAAKVEVTAQSVENWRNGTTPQPRAARALLSLLAEETSR